MTQLVVNDAAVRSSVLFARRRLRGWTRIESAVECIAAPTVCAMTMPEDVRRQRLARAPLVDLSLVSLAAIGVARLAPRSEPWLGPPRGPIAALVIASFVLASVAFFRAKKYTALTALDQFAWGSLLLSSAAASGASSAPLGLQGAVHAATLLVLASRDPSDALMVVAGASAALSALVRMAMPNAAPVAPVAILAAVAMLAFVMVVSLARRALRATAERDALLGEIARVANVQATQSTQRRERRNSLPPPPKQRKSADEDELASWDALAERVRQTVSLLTENNGVSAVINVDVKGLAPPSQKMRSNLVKIVHEVAQQAIRHAEPRTIELNLSRGGGGVLIELIDADANDDGARHRKAIAPLKGRVTPLGGTADVERGDRGWKLRVQLPAEQLN